MNFKAVKVVNFDLSGNFTKISTSTNNAKDTALIIPGKNRGEAQVCGPLFY